MVTNFLPVIPQSQDGMFWPEMWPVS